MQIKLMAKKESADDPLEERLCLLEFTGDDLVNEIVNLKEELKVFTEKQSETQKTTDHLSESLSLIKNEEIIDINSFKKISNDLYDFQAILLNQNQSILSTNERIKRTQQTLSDVMKELEMLRVKLSKKTMGKLLEFKK